MGIYINGMDMPKSCIECLLHRESACKAFTTIEPWTFKDDERVAFCPLTEVPEPKWIPCSERLPEKGEVVLITNGKGNVRCGQYRSEHDVRDGTHYWWWKGKTVETVLAWMPLPKPYREDGEV